MKKRSYNSKWKPVAERIAKALFIGGDGIKAGRLVLETTTKLHGSGWCESAVVDQIETILARTKVKP